MKSKKQKKIKQKKKRRLWPLWLALSVVLVMAAGYYGMLYMGAQMPRAYTPEQAAVPMATLPQETPVPAPTPELFSAEEQSPLPENSNPEEPESAEELPEEPEQAIAPPVQQVEEEDDPIAIADDPDWYLRLVNRDHPIPEDYQIELVELPGGQLIDARIYEPLMAMLNDADYLGYGPVVVAGYRTWEKQQSLMDERVSGYLAQGYSEENARAMAEQWVSVPGHSEHQLGISVDINGDVWDIYAWLQNHSWEYGFIQRYPADKTDITGCREEVWHYRYVGKDAARAIYESGLCLEEYLAYMESE